MAVRTIVVRVMEWRASRLSDPAERLRFLQRAKSRRGRGSGRIALVALALGLAAGSIALVRPVWRRPPPAQPRFETRRSPSKPAAVPGRVWLVEANERFDLYSNGLQVENRYATFTQGRAYLAFSREGIDTRPARLRTDPAGIVYHTTESHIAPFEEGQNQTLRRAGEGLLDFVRRNHSYHFVIDRFGRVFRIVREGDYANHAGHSVWADQNWVYVNLNESFIGIAFEAKSRPEDPGLPANPAQLHAARILTEMLRARYKIPAGNCVAHAQVSVNPSNGRAGYHTDWATNLPFAELGLGDNYQRPIASIALFGFHADADLADAGGGTLRPAIQAAETQVRQQAAAHRMPLDRYREILQRKYRDASGASRASAVLGENN